MTPCLRSPLVLASRRPPDRLRLACSTGRGRDAESRLKIYKAGDRQTTVAASAREDRRDRVAEGMYDAQAIREREARAQHPLGGSTRGHALSLTRRHHLEVINFQNGFGALEVRGRARRPGRGIFLRQPRPGGCEAVRRDGLRAVRRSRRTLRSAGAAGGTSTWHPDVEVPADRTRLWIEPMSGGQTAKLSR